MSTPPPVRHAEARPTRRRRPVPLLLAVLLVSACSAGPHRAAPSPRQPVVSVTPASNPYLTALLADEPLHLWPLSGMAGLRTGDAAADIGSVPSPARVSLGVLHPTEGPTIAGHDTQALRFPGDSALRARTVPELVTERPWSLEFLFRRDACSDDWGQILGTGGADRRGRQGINVFNSPHDVLRPCQLVVELWQDGHFQGGCGTVAPLVPGHWGHFVVTFDARVARCYYDGHYQSRSPVPTSFGSDPDAPFGIGSDAGGFSGQLTTGSLADVAVYAEALAPATIAAHARRLR
jgi:hypothetical protein